MTSPTKAVVSVPSYFQRNTTDNLYYLFRQTYKNEPLTSRTATPASGGHPSVGFYNEIIDSAVLQSFDATEGHLCETPAHNGIDQGAIIDDGTMFFGYKGDFYSKNVVLEGVEYEIRAVRYAGIFNDDFYISILDANRTEVARVDEDWQLISGENVDFVNAALNAVCNLEAHFFNGFLDPLNPRSHADITFSTCI
ncbi:MAG: hypothetical protein Q7S68_04760 [Deltaproteobacteria bacterium]|nr:hypothetical protein [Deltaproteobacteria bacterium]